MPTKDELMQIAEELRQISTTGRAGPRAIQRLRPLGYIILRGDYPLDYTVGLTRAGQSIVETYVTNAASRRSLVVTKKDAGKLLLHDEGFQIIVKSASG